MPIVINPTPGDSAANSYATVAAADTYMETVPSFSATWAAFTDDQKAARLISATRAIDRLSLISTKFSDDQALAFPRTSQEDTAIIPKEVVEALFEIIIHLDVQIDETTGRPARDINSVTVVGVVSVDYGGAGAGSRFPGDGAVVSGSMDAVMALLRDWLVVSTAATFLVTK